MNVSGRTFCNIVLVSLILSLGGVLIDADHTYALLRWNANGRWFHEYLLSNWVVLVLCGIIYGIIVYAFAVRWDVITIDRIPKITRTIGMNGGKASDC